jgi:hypothetical protein
MRSKSFIGTFLVFFLVLSYDSLAQKKLNHKIKKPTKVNSPFDPPIIVTPEEEKMDQDPLLYLMNRVQFTNSTGQDIGFQLNGRNYKIAKGMDFTTDEYSQDPNFELHMNDRKVSYTVSRSKKFMIYWNEKIGCFDIYEIESQ